MQHDRTPGSHVTITSSQRPSATAASIVAATRIPNSGSSLLCGRRFVHSLVWLACHDERRATDFRGPGLHAMTGKASHLGHHGDDRADGSEPPSTGDRACKEHALIRPMASTSADSVAEG